ncbi:hemoglobin subunit beta-like isoform X1 [Pagrus major]|uniref:hemoglobin subunit beta-like isoform X1 n=1 Tax=Pagrus major TaxID=143350 RepID=UPI003CC8D873
MVHWTDKERSAVRAVWEKVDVDQIGSEALARVLIVYPWTERYFGCFGDLFTATAILNNPKVAAHGKVVLKALEGAVKNMDNIKGAYAALSRMHCETLKVDPDNFKVRAVGRLHHNHSRLQTEGRPQPSDPSHLAEVPVCGCRGYGQSVLLKR